MRGVIRLNDPISHGGKVTSASPNSFVNEVCRNDFLNPLRFVFFT